MTKSRKKKKNYKLRRRVKRTIAALVMIMAIVIAAIPVENLGTMRAAADSEQLTDIDYTKYAYGEPGYDFGVDMPITNGLQLTKESDDYRGQEVKTYIFTGGVLVEKLLVKPKADGDKVGIVSGLADGADNNVVINSEEYLDYVVIDSAYMDAVVEALKNEKYKASASSVQKTNSLPTALNGISTTTSLVTEKLTIDQFQIDTISNPVTLNYTSNNNPYTTIIPASGTDEDIQDILKEQAKYNDWAADIDEYNQKMQNIQSKIDDFMKKYNVTTPDTGAATTEWTALVDEMNTIQNPGNFELSFEDLCKGVGGITDNKSSFLHRTICDRAVDGNVTLKGASLIEAGDGKFIIRMLPDSVSSSDQITDASNHLITGKITVEGIKNDAFKGNRDITSVSIPNTVKFIGARAFYKCTGLATVNFADGSNLEKIGAEAFLNANVSNIHFPVAIKQIGVGAFAKSALVTAEFDDKAEGNPIVIWPYAFFGCEQLANVEFPTYEVNAKTNFVIGKGAFAVDSRSNGGAMTAFTFPEQIVDIISTNNTYSTEFGIKNPADKTTGVEENEDAYDYILSGRNRLEKVTFPIELGDTKIPDNTFIGCFGLTNVIFPESADAAYYTPTELFKSVEHANGLVVDGPANKRGAANNPASPRVSTRKAVDVDKEPVLYRFFIDGKEYYETGDGENCEFVATYEIQEDGNATLTKYDLQDSGYNGLDVEVRVRDKVGDHKVTKIAEGCFGPNVLDHVYKLVIPDNSVEEISDGAFKDASKLQWVELGDSVKVIGNDAFANCEKLENVVFSKNLIDIAGDAFWESQDNNITIGETAFKTNSDYLTFHGAIHSTYTPFRHAMGKDNAETAKFGKSDRTICYKTDDPTNLVVVRDAKSGKSVLIDYPHYEEIDVFNEEVIKEITEDLAKDEENPVQIDNYSIIEHFEYTINLRAESKGKYSGVEIPTVARNIVNGTLDMTLPDGVDSIDSQKYFKDSDNHGNFAYLGLQYKHEYTDVAHRYARSEYDRKLNVDTYGDPDVQKLYSDDSYSANLDTERGKDIHAGLFSGFFRESVGNTLARDLSYTLGQWGLIGFNYAVRDETIEYTENNPGGNDHLTYMKMTSVEELPPYAFQSCENLLEVAIGAGMKTIGELPFRDCKALKNIDTTGNERYKFNNMLLFDTNNPEYAGNVIVQCLEGIGRNDRNGYGATNMNSSTNPELKDVVAISPQAFAFCENLTNVDLSDTTVRQIPEKCFQNCTNLGQITLPESAIQVDDNAFAGVNRLCTVTIPNPSCVLSDTAFTFDETGDKILYVIEGVKYIDEKTKEESPLYVSYKQIEAKHPGEIIFSSQGNTFTLQFVGSDLAELGTIKVVREENPDGSFTQTPNAEEAWKLKPPAPGLTGYRFSKWISRVGDKVLEDQATCADVMEDRMIIATYIPDPSVVVPDPYGPYKLTIEKGQGTVLDPLGTPGTSFTLEGGSQVLLQADAPAEGSTFKSWTVTDEKDPTKDYSNLFVNITSANTTFTMPNADVKVTATYTDGSGDKPGGDDNKPGGDDNKPGGDDNKPGGDDDNNKPGGDDDNNKPGTDTEKKYKLTVNYGSGSGEYKAGESVTISAYAPDSSTRVFSRWSTSTSGLGFGSATSVTTTIIMPAADATVTANYRTRTDDDDDEDDERPDRRPGTNTSTTVTTPPTNSGTTTPTGTVSGTGTGTNPATSSNNDGNKIYITKNGVSNKDLASISVSGSTDNFIVKISETPEATAAVEEALINRHGSLDNLVYFPMDISLYDATGQNKITDSYGLNITVTMPIPDVLIQYGGNCRVAAADNGNLQQLTPRFTTIDGIACISFVPPHFSPYVIYVDTANLVAGSSLDSTPATGDPIHPKWFLAIGMACISILLFVTSDERKRKGFRTA